MLLWAMLNVGENMKVITEERLILLRNNLAETGKNKEACLIDYLITDVLKEIDTLTPKETDLILAAEKYADLYSDDDRQDIKTDVLNAFYHGSEWSKKNK